MRTKLLLATAAATLAFAAPAAAAPFTDVGPLSGPAGQVTFGGGVAAAPGQIDWGVPAGGGATNPALLGRLRMFNVPGVQAQLQTEYYNAAHVLIGTQTGVLRNGIAGGLATYPVNLGPGPNVSHVHEQLIVNGVVVDTAFCTLGQAAC